MMPTKTMEVPRVVTINTGSRLWMSSDEMSIKKEPNPNTQIPVGNTLQIAGVLLEDRGLFEPFTNAPSSKLLWAAGRLLYRSGYGINE